MNGDCGFGTDCEDCGDRHGQGLEGGPLPPPSAPAPIVDLHFWKCYMKEGTTFQTAKLFSVEVDYYHFGTCRLVDGAYFCGDHSCQTFKHIGQKKTTRSSQVIERIDDSQNPGRTVNPYGPTDSRFSKYVYGDSGVEGGRGRLRAQDQMAATYGTYPGKGLDAVVASELHLPSDLQMDSEHSTAKPCKLSCDLDTSCVAYGTSTAAHGAPPDNCHHYTRTTLPIRVGLNLEAALVTTQDWTTYVKLTNPKTRTWLHGETTPYGYFGDAPTGSARGTGWPARRLEDLY